MHGLGKTVGVIVFSQKIPCIYHNNMKLSEIIAAVENGAGWEYKPSNSGFFHTGIGLSDCLRKAAEVLHGGGKIRLAPQKKTAPLGPEDWDGVWWVSDYADGSSRYMVTSVHPTSVSLIKSGGVSERSFIRLMASEYQRSQDGKTWTPCSKEVEE